MRHTMVLLALLGLGVGCTTTDAARLPSQGAPGDIFVTQESVKEPYESLGVIQITRKGVLIFGFLDPAGTDLAAAMQELEPQVRSAGADGLMNTRFEMSQYTPAAKILAAIFFFAPLPSAVTVTGELVRLKRGGPAPMPVAPAAQGAPL